MALDIFPFLDVILTKKEKAVHDDNVYPLCT